MPQVTVVLILTQRHDVHADRLCEEVIRAGGRAVRLNAEDAAQVQVTHFNGEFKFRVEDHHLSARDVRSVFVRRKPTLADFGGVDAGATVDVDSYVAMQRENLFQELFFSVQKTARCYNPYGPMVANMGKLGQQDTAIRAGFTVAASLAGGSRDDVSQFVARVVQSGARVCTKPLAAKDVLIGGETFTRYTEIVTDTQCLAEEDIDSCPLIWQEYVEKDYELRVTAIDDNLIAVRIDSQAAPEGTQVDWRKYNYPRTPHSVYALPEEIALAIRRFHEMTGLRFSAFDLVRAKDGRYVFLETNPSGQWLWLETLTGAPITAMIARTLVGASEDTGRGARAALGSLPMKKQRLPQTDPTSASGHRQ